MTDIVVSARGIGVRYGSGRVRSGRAAERGGGVRGADRSERTDGARRLAAHGRAVVHALTGVDLSCHAGEVVGVLGPNGAGKSTLLRVLATTLRPSTGTLRLFGSPARPMPALRRRLGYASDTAAHFDALSGRENAIFFARAAGLAAHPAGAAVDDLVDRLDLADDARRAVREYSFGMRRKLALVEALAHEPALVLLDEPTVGLDPRALAALRELLRERARAGAAVVVATNDVREAQDLCDRVVFLHRGRVALEGEPEGLLRRSRGRTPHDVRVRAARGAATGAGGGAPDGVTVEAGGAVVDAARSVGGADVVGAGPERIAFRSARGGAALPEICRAILDAGAEILSIDVREPDLRDIFLDATGDTLEDASVPADERRREPVEPLAARRSGPTPASEGGGRPPAGTHEDGS